ncbi:hypothetical protein [Halalkalicoccus salilacus]|uniref:hypothetical protein n=1 Tax=Halalkalicoccus salilacus TaxID=3117459 RepID=UPI00300F7087
MQGRVSRRRFVATAGAATITGFAGCGDQGEGEGGDGNEEGGNEEDEDETGYG